MYDKTRYDEIISREYSGMSGVHFLNTCAVGFPAKSVIEVGQSFFDDYTKMLLDSGVTNYEPLRSATREKIAALIGGSASEIAFTSSTTQGTAALALSLSLKPGDNVVIFDLENPSCLLPWLQASRTRGFELRIVKTEHGVADAGKLIAAMDSRTKAAVVSAVEYGSGYRCDLPSISSAIHMYVGILAVDAIQALGRLSINVRALGIDFLSCGGFKGIAAGFGIGFIWCSHPLLKRLIPPTIGVQGVESCPHPPDTYERNTKPTLSSSASVLELGAHNSYGIAVLSAALDVLLELNTSEIESHILNLEKDFRYRLNSPWFTPYGHNPERRSGIIAGIYTPAIYNSANEAMRKSNILLTHSPGYIRCAFSAYSNSSDVEALLDVLNRSL